MTTPQLLVVLGATGNQGGSVVNSFIGRPGWKVRGLTRNTASQSARSLADRGVEVVTADIDDISSLDAAFEGAYAIYSITDFWGAYGDSKKSTKLRAGQTMIQWAHEHELQQRKNVFDSAARTVGLQRLVFSALSHASKWSRGKYTHVHHFDSKAEAVEYGRTKYPELWSKTSIIQIGYYLSSLLSSPLNRPTKDEAGVYVVASKLKGDVKLPIVATEEDTGPCVVALLNTKPGKNLIAYRAWMTQEELYALWGQTVGVKSKYITLPATAKLNGMSADMAEDYDDSVAYFAEFGFEGRDDPTVIHPNDLSTDLSLPSVEDWIHKQDWSNVLKE